MGFGVYRVFTATMTSGGTLTAQANVGRIYGSVYVEVPTMTSNSQLHIQVANSSAGTFRRVTHPMINQSTVSTNDFAIASSLTNRVIPIPNGFQFYKVETTATVDSGCTFNIICADEG